MGYRKEVAQVVTQMIFNPMQNRRRNYSEQTRK